MRHTSDSRMLAADGANPAKRLATLQACAALAGYTLIASDDDHGRPVYCIVLGALCERLATLDDVEAWLAAVGAVEVTMP